MQKKRFHNVVRLKCTFTTQIRNLQRRTQKHFTESVMVKDNSYTWKDVLYWKGPGVGYNIEKSYNYPYTNISVDEFFRNASFRYYEWCGLSNFQEDSSIKKEAMANGIWWAFI